MDKKNKFFLILFLIGVFAVLIGAIHKVNGNENAFIPLMLGMIFQLIAVICLITYNFSKLKNLLK